MISNRRTADSPYSWIRAVGSLNLYWMNLSHCARTAAEMTHLYVSRRDHDLAIAPRLHVLSVDAQTEWPWAAPVRRVKSSQPGHGAGIRFMVSRATHRPACTL